MNFIDVKNKNTYGPFLKSVKEMINIDKCYNSLDIESFFTQISSFNIHKAYVDLILNEKWPELLKELIYKEFKTFKMAREKEKINDILLEFNKSIKIIIPIYFKMQ